MRHARPADLDRVEPLLEKLRALDGLKERTRGVFYRRGKAFLHFHEDGGAMFADVRGPDDWERFPAKQGAALVKRAKQLVGS